ncbi:MAG: ribosomal protein S9, small subunit ribosomal protein S9 [Parcubacteria group bacterium GW2011_GWC1_45_14]|nr:MAG: 30S ribosomal protein S9 [Candidatus Moranbacteria bacterium GW2011_GWC2_45_10]KKT95535.1 MAG: ribosomal protein S9, small subunit ribosomal protein S9 [Parcubacteria group bacterium GW2011_GWC1_45_14]
MAVKKEAKKAPAKKAPAKKAAAKKAAPKKAEAKVEVKAEVKEVKAKVEKKISAKYFYGVGRRKTSVAQVRLYENDKATDADLVINDKEMKDYFPTLAQQNVMTAPLKGIGMHGKFTMTALVKGGGMTGQVEAVQLGISRALVAFDESLKKSLRDNGFLTRDARKVERKKPGLKKARRAPQWAKR